MANSVDPYQMPHSTLLTTAYTVYSGFSVLILTVIMVYNITDKFFWCHILSVTQGPVVQSVVSLTSLFVVKMLTVLVSTISNSQVFLLKKCEYSHFFSKNISVYAIFNDQRFNDTLTNGIISFEQLGPDCFPTAVASSEISFILQVSYLP